MKKVLCCIVISCCMLITKAQKPLTLSDEKYLMSQAVGYIKLFKEKLQEIGSSNDLSDRERNILIRTTLSFFKKGATVQVLNKKAINTYNIETYLKDIVANYKKRFSVVYTTIEITSFNLKDLIPEKDASGNIISYKGSYNYVQGFCAKKDAVNSEAYNSKDPDSYDICNKTWKTGEVIIEKRYSPTTGDRWIVLLSDIKATRMKDLKAD